VLEKNLLAAKLAKVHVVYLSFTLLTLPCLALHPRLAAQSAPSTKARTAKTASSAAPATLQQPKAKHLTHPVSFKPGGGSQATAYLPLAMLAHTA
jgi:hypothetical protein